MGTLRKLERQAVRTKMKKDNVKHSSFKDYWQDFRNKKYVVKDENDNIVQDNTPRNTQKKKRVHFDNRQQYIKMFAFMDKLQDERRAKTTEKSDNEDN